MHYPLPDEEDIEAIRASLAPGIRARETKRARNRVLNEYLAGRESKEALEPERIALQVEAIVQLRRARATEQSWADTRNEVYLRDRCICHVCGDYIPFHLYECGHIIDRVCGGSDRPSNLVAMCALCNRLKPCHESRAAYIAWIEAGDWRASIMES